MLKNHCIFCVVSNKIAISYIKRHISPKKWKQSTSNRDIDPSIKESTSNNYTLICPLHDFRFDHSTSPSQKKGIEIKCINCNEILLSYKSCACMATARSHGLTKLRKHPCYNIKNNLILRIMFMNNHCLVKADEE